MYVTAEEFLDMLHEIRERYRDSHLNLDDPDVMHTLLRREFPEVEGVVPPPSYETIRQRYIPQEWRMLIPESRRGSPAISAIGPDEVVSTTDPVAEWCRQVVADLDSLRSDAFTAMSYVVQRSRGADSRTAMDRARATGQVIQMFIMFSRVGIEATHRSVSGSTGRPRDIHQQRAQQSTEQVLVSRARSTGTVYDRRSMPLRPVSMVTRPGYPARAPSTVIIPRTAAPVRTSGPPTMSVRSRPPAPAATTASPVRTQERLRRMAAQAGSPGSTRRR
jgi:hypothetical protein